MSLGIKEKNETRKRRQRESVCAILDNAQKKATQNDESSFETEHFNHGNTRYGEDVDVGTVL